MNLVSIITASYNKEKYISETILSVINQTYTNWELIIVDDVSTDNTLIKIKEFCNKDNRISYYLNDSNKGANYSRNFGIQKAKGKYIIFLDADDLLSTTCLENRIKVMDDKNLNFCVFTMGVFYKDIGDSEYLWSPNSKHPLNDFLQHKLPWSILQPIWQRDVLIQLGGFDKQFNRFQDVELHTRALFNDTICFEQIIEKPDCFYRIDEERKNYNAYEFLKRRMDATILYYSKFYKLACDTNKTKFLLCTVYISYLQITHQLKQKAITNSQFKELESILLNANYLKTSFFNKLVFFLGKHISLLPFRIPGVNFMIINILKI